MRESRWSRRIGPRCRGIVVVPLLAGASLGLLGCGDADAALQVGRVSYSQDEILGLTEERRMQLVELTSLGLATSTDELERLGSPLIERRADSLLIDRFRAWLVVEREAIPDDVLEARYASSPRFELVVRHVVALAEPDDPDSVHESARSSAREALRRIEEGDDFASVAADLSEEPGAAERGGRLEPGREGTWVDAFWRAASGLDEGEHTSVVRTDYGYHVIRLDERRVVPFEEVRSEVLVDAARLLGGHEQAWDEWVERTSAEIDVDSSALARFLDAPRSLPDSVALATHGEDSYEVGRFLTHVAALPEERHTALMEGGAANAGTEVVEAFVRHRAVDEARGRGLEIPPGTRERLGNEWRTRAASWASVLRFGSGASLASVKTSALEALATSRQNAAITRREMEPYGPLLRAAYPIVE